MNKPVIRNWMRYWAGTLAVSGMLVVGACSTSQDRTTADNSTTSPERDNVSMTDVDDETYAEDETYADNNNVESETATSEMGTADTETTETEAHATVDADVDTDTDAYGNTSATVSGTAQTGVETNDNDATVSGTAQSGVDTNNTTDYSTSQTNTSATIDDQGNTSVTTNDQRSTTQNTATAKSSNTSGVSANRSGGSVTSIDRHIQKHSEVNEAIENALSELMGTKELAMGGATQGNDQNNQNMNYSDNTARENEQTGVSYDRMTNTATDEQEDVDQSRDNMADEGSQTTDREDTSLNQTGTTTDSMVNRDQEGATYDRMGNTDQSNIDAQGTTDTDVNVDADVDADANLDVDADVNVDADADVDANVDAEGTTGTTGNDVDRSIGSLRNETQTEAQGNTYIDQTDEDAAGTTDADVNVNADVDVDAEGTTGTTDAQGRATVTSEVDQNADTGNQVDRSIGSLRNETQTEAQGNTYIDQTSQDAAANTDTDVNADADVDVNVEDEGSYAGMYDSYMDPSTEMSDEERRMIQENRMEYDQRRQSMQGQMDQQHQAYFAPAVEARPDVNYSELIEEIKEEMRLPKEMEDAKMEGTLLVQFLIDEQGEITNAEVIDGVITQVKEDGTTMSFLRLTEKAKEGVVDEIENENLIEFSDEQIEQLKQAVSQESLRVMQSREGKWQPAMQDDKPVKTLVVLPIRFDVED